MATDTLIRQRGIRRRMRCDGATAARIEKAFTTAEQLVEAVESDDPLTDIDGIGPKTAETIEEWWEHRFEREKAMPGAEWESTGAKTATIHNIPSWADALGMDAEEVEA